MTRAASAAGPTLAVVAREAGVSVPTASKVVNGRDDVAPETRRRVNEVLDRLGYVRRRRSGPTGPHGMVDLVLSAMDGPGAAVVRGVERAAHAEGLEVVVSAGRHLGRDRLDRLVARGTAGVLFHGDGPSSAQAAWLNRHRVPYVLVDPGEEPPPGTVWVGAADRTGGRAAAEHLLELGHERVAAVAGHAPGRSGSAWLAGWREALAAAGLRARPEYVRHPGPGDRDADTRGGRDGEGSGEAPDSTGSQGCCTRPGGHSAGAAADLAGRGDAGPGGPGCTGAGGPGPGCAGPDAAGPGGTGGRTGPGCAGPGGTGGRTGPGTADAGAGGTRSRGRTGPVAPEDPAEALGRAWPDRGWARLRTLELLDLPEPPTAVCVGSDAWAPGVYEALAERGLRVPDDMAVVGYGDLPEARWAVPGLTTVRRPLDGMAAAGLALLVRSAADEPPDGLPVELPTELVVRSSTAPPPATGPRGRRRHAPGRH